MKTILADDLRQQASEILKENPQIMSNPDVFLRLILERDIPEQLVAYFTEVISDGNRGLVDIQILQDQTTMVFNPPRKVYQIEVFPSEDQFKVRSEMDDLNTRMKIAKMIGLKELPSMDPNAIYELDGYLGRKFPKDTLDSVDLVKSVREDWLDPQ
jgi:hypothetical protein